MRHFFRSARFAPVILASVLALSACNNSDTQTVDKPPLEPADSTAQSAAPTTEASPDATAQAPEPEASAGGQTYREKDGLFEISLPAGYNFQETGSGVAFVSSDQSFGGSVDFGSAQGNQLDNSQLENALKAEYEKRLNQVTWQASEVQPDGSVRVDWVGQDTDGNTLDAVSFVEQRGDTIFILNLFGINKAYQDYNSDAEAIVSSYKVRQE